MSKIICDICGTSYPENAKQCPVCGCVRPGDVQRVTNQVSADEKGASGYTHVKGGRFSKTNVKKRNKVNSGTGKTNNTRTTAGNTKAKPKYAAAEPANEKELRNNRGAAIVAIVLLLAIIGVVIYIAMGFFNNIAGTGDDSGTPTGQAILSCQSITLDTETVYLDRVGGTQHLGCTRQPEGTTDKVTYTSENPKIATVDAKGNITAVAEGETKIIIQCGNIKKICTVVCEFVVETLPTVAPTTPGPTEATTPDYTTPAGSMLNRTMIKLCGKGDTWELYSGDAAKNVVTYKSDNEKIATFSDGKVVAVGAGTTTVYASYGGETAACIVHCYSITAGSNITDADNDPIPLNRTGKVYNVQANLNVRSGPGTGNEQTGKVLVGDQVKIVEVQYALKDVDRALWGRLETGGWVHMGYIKLDTK